LFLQGRTLSLLSRTFLFSFPATTPVVPGSSVALEVIVVVPPSGMVDDLVVEMVVFPRVVTVFLPVLVNAPGCRDVSQSSRNRPLETLRVFEGDVGTPQVLGVLGFYV
jgi:hypothetical protein